MQFFFPPAEITMHFRSYQEIFKYCKIHLHGQTVLGSHNEFYSQKRMHHAQTKRNSLMFQRSKYTERILNVGI